MMSKKMLMMKQMLMMTHGPHRAPVRSVLRDEERARREAEARRRLADEAKVEKKPQEKRAEGETGGSR